MYSSHCGALEIVYHPQLGLTGLHIPQRLRAAESTPSPGEILSAGGPLITSIKSSHTGLHSKTHSELEAIRARQGSHWVFLIPPFLSVKIGKKTRTREKKTEVRGEAVLVKSQVQTKKKRRWEQEGC